MKGVWVFVVWMLCLGLAEAACPSWQACLTWEAPTKMTDGSDIPASKAISYNVYNSSALLGATHALSYIAAGLPSGEQCFSVTAVVDEMESAHTNEVCKLIRPAPPTDGSIESPTDGAIEERS